MKFGYECIQPLREELLAFMERHKFNTLDDFRGKSLPFFTTHADLVQRQAQRKTAQKTPAKKAGVTADSDWRGDSFVQQSDTLTQG
jgi:dihydropyrimidine dehydrogenase (NADP+)/dihydropyrimidine dehydrogenase (NAD+) subunit PreA